MRITIYFFLAFSVLLISSVQGQINVFGADWVKGKLLLQDSEGDTIQCTLRFELDNNLVQIYLANNTVKTYTSRQIKWIQAYDPASKRDRNFYVFPYALNNRYVSPTIFEMLTEGTVSLLGREKIVVVQNTWAGSRFTQAQLSFDFYFGFTDGKIRVYRGTRKDFEYLLKDKSGYIRTFIEDSDLRYNDKDDLIRIINQYNYSNYKDKVSKYE
ncbi:hypothetical protein [Xanthocytophaga flava]|nr:hypothetical protein [Xanthocytophaga flavus]